MALGIPSFPLTDFWQPERLLLVRTADALRLCREGSHEALSRQESLLCLSGARGKQTSEARGFVARAHPVRLSLADCDDAMLFDQLDSWIKAGTLIVVRESGQGGTLETPSLAKQRRTIRALGQTGRKALKFEGRVYRLSADADLGRIPDRDDYVVVERAEAARVLDGMAKLAAADQSGGFQAARDLLTQDWHPPLSPDGIVLLRKVPARQSVPKVELPLAKPQQRSSGPVVEAGPEEETCRPCAALREAKQAEALKQAAHDGSPFCAECGPPSAAAA